MFPEIRPTPVSAEILEAFESEWDFMGLAVELLREAASYVCVASCIMGEQPTWNRDQAIVGGHAVRLFKLLSALLDQVCQRRRETADVLARLVFETAVNARFLVQEWNLELANSFVIHSLRHERKLSDRIQANIAERGGSIQPIEDRMLKSIYRTACIAGISLDQVDLKDKSPWGKKNLAERARTIGWGDAYDGVFGGMSHNVHGSWQDLYAHHLSVVKGTQFTPKLEWSRPRPQPLFALGRISLEVSRDVCSHLGGVTALNQLDDRILDLHQRIEMADQAHEAYLSGKSWPEI